MFQNNTEDAEKTMLCNQRLKKKALKRLKNGALHKNKNNKFKKKCELQMTCGLCYYAVCTWMFCQVVSWCDWLCAWMFCQVASWCDWLCVAVCVDVLSCDWLCVAVRVHV